MLGSVDDAQRAERGRQHPFQLSTLRTGRVDQFLRPTQASQLSLVSVVMAYCGVMRIAVLGWGSLVWDPDGRTGSPLKVSPGSEWSATGPELPVEFARIAQNGRLTLIVVPGYEVVSRTSWILSAESDFEKAALNLADREVITSPPKRRSRIHGIDSDGTQRGPINGAVAATVSRWLNDRDDVDAAVWTGLEGRDRWRDHGFDSFTVDNALTYLAKADTGANREIVFEYIRNAPPETDTPVRRAFEQLFPS